MQIRLFLAFAAIGVLSFSGMGAKYTHDGIIYSVNSSNKHASVQGPADKSVSKVNIPKTITLKTRPTP